MNQCFTIAKKEVIALFRDRVFIVLLFIPIFVFPALSIGMDYISQTSAAEIKLILSYEDDTQRELFLDFMKESISEKVQLIDDQSGLCNNYDVSVIFEGNLIIFQFKANSFKSVSSATKISEEFRNYYANRLSELYSDAYTIQLLNEKGESDSVSDGMFKLIAPLVIILLVFQNSSGIANDLFAGEKERGTMEMLLSSGVRSDALFVGKLLVLLLFGVINMSLCIFSYGLSSCVFNKDKQLSSLLNNYPIQNIIVLILILTMMTLLASTISLAVSMISSTIRLSQTINEFISLFFTGVSVILTFEIAEADSIQFIPVLGTIPLFINSFNGIFDSYKIVIVMLENAFVCIALLHFGKKYISSEKILR